MTAEDYAIARLMTEEGFRATVYTDVQGHQTIGYGFNVGAGISQKAALALLTTQVDELSEALAVYPWYASLDMVRASVCLDCAFNLGEHGLLQFQNMIVALGQKNWQQAHDELLDSEAARLLPERYGELAEILLTGEA